MRLIVYLTAFMSFFSASVLFAENVSCEQQQCVAIIDAGSTGSRIHVYSYDVDTTNSPINITERWSKKIKPGFATIEANAPTIDAYFSTLLAGAPSYNLPVYLYATAGMRLLPPSKQQVYYYLTRDWFKNRQNWQLINAKTITGSEEGLLGWLAVNYQLGTLAADSTPVGVLDMGGASVQIVFPVARAEQINTDDIKQLDLYGQHFKLFIHSFLGLGQTEVSHQFLDSPSCFSNGYPIPSGTVAKGDAYQCKDEISALMNAVHHVSKTVQSVIRANPVQTWYTIGGLTALAKSPPFSYNQNHFTNQEMLAQADNDVCQQQWQNLTVQYPTDDYLYGYCLFPAYYYALIVNGYGIEPQQPINYLGDEQGNDWTEGAVIFPLETADSLG